MKKKSVHFSDVTGLIRLTLPVHKKLEIDNIIAEDNYLNCQQNHPLQDSE